MEEKVCGCTSSACSEKGCCDELNTCKGKGDCCRKKITLNPIEKSVLLEFLQIPYFPISRFIMSSSKESEARFVCLEPVYLENREDSMEKVKEIGAVLSKMEEKGLLTLDYDIALEGYDYDLHTGSELYGYFKKTVEEGAKKARFLCDTAEIEAGSMALTEYGEQMAKKIEQEQK